MCDSSLLVSCADEIFIFILVSCADDDMKLWYMFVYISDMRTKNSKSASTVPQGTKLFLLCRSQKLTDL